MNHYVQILLQCYCGNMSYMTHSVRFFSPEILPTLMQNIGLALLTILIPVTLFIFSLEKYGLFEFDKIVILDKVVRAKLLLVSIGMMFLPLFFWEYDFFRSILFLIFIVGAVVIIKILFNSYRWIKDVEVKERHDTNSFRNRLRNKYLDEIKADNLLEKEKVWLLIWRRKDINVDEERNFTDKFVSNIDALVVNCNFEMSQRYLQNYYHTIKSRALYDVVIFKNFLAKLLQWYFLVCNQSEACYEITFEDIVQQLISEFVLSALQGRNAFLLFDGLQEGIIGKDKVYVENLFNRSVCHYFFDGIASSKDDFNIWKHYFPKEWKVTKETYMDKDNVVSKIWFDQFIEWSWEMIAVDEPEKRFNNNLNKVVIGLFPSVDVELWSELLTMIARSNNHMKSLVEQQTNFGWYGRPIVCGWGDGGSREVKYNDMRKETMELALLRFKAHFNPEKLRQFILDLEALECNKGSLEEKRREEFIIVFQEMLTISAEARTSSNSETKN